MELNISKEDYDRLEDTFTYHEPTGETVPKYQAIRSTGKDLALLVMQECPNSREKSMALTKIEEAVMWANASIARSK